MFARLSAHGTVGAMAQSVRTDNATTFVQSELFSRTFREGMALVEETANYLDGAGRDTSRSLSRSAALVYAGSSMRLTTQLMQIASWLLVMRAVREGEMTVDEAGEDKYRLKEKETALGELREEGLPENLIRLVETSAQLYSRIARLDRELFTNQTVGSEKQDAAAQQQALFAAFIKTN